jgi:hypothetical protein
MRGRRVAVDEVWTLIHFPSGLPWDSPRDLTSVIDIADSGSDVDHEFSLGMPIFKIQDRFRNITERIFLAMGAMTVNCISATASVLQSLMLIVTSEFLASSRRLSARL